MADILYGTPAQIGLVSRSMSLHDLLKDDPRFSYQGRIVVTGHASDAPKLAAHLSRLQGYASAIFVPREQHEDYHSYYESQGLIPESWDQYHGRDKAIATASAFLANFTPPAGLTLKETGPDTDNATIHAICAMSVEQGVTPVAGSTMRGDSIDGTILFVEADDGRIASYGGGFMSFHEGSPWHDEAFWGMLATAPDFRGRKLACWVGAEAITRLAARHGARGFYTGVKPDNASSQAMCNRLGLARSGYVFAGALEPTLMGDQPVTR